MCKAVNGPFSAEYENGMVALSDGEARVVMPYEAFKILFKSLRDADREHRRVAAVATAKPW